MWGGRDGKGPGLTPVSHYLSGLCLGTGPVTSDETGTAVSLPQGAYGSSMKVILSFLSVGGLVLAP